MQARPRCHVNLPSIVKVVDDGAGFAGRSSLWLPAARLCEQVWKRLDCWVTTCDADDDDVIKTECAPAPARAHLSTHPSTHTSASMAEVVMATNFERILMVVQTPVVRGRGTPLHLIRVLSSESSHQSPLIRVLSSERWSYRVAFTYRWTKQDLGTV